MRREKCISYQNILVFLILNYHYYIFKNKFTTFFFVIPAQRVFEWMQEIRLRIQRS